MFLSCVKERNTVTNLLILKTMSNSASVLAKTGNRYYDNAVFEYKRMTVKNLLKNKSICEQSLEDEECQDTRECLAIINAILEQRGVQ